MQSILVISFSELDSDSRVRRQLRLFKDAYQVTVVGLTDPGIHGVKFVRAVESRRNMGWHLRTACLLGLRRFERYYWAIPEVRSCLERLDGRSFNYYIANDPLALPLGLRLAQGRPLLYDAHEYAPRKQEDHLGWRLIMKPFNVHLMSQYLPKVSAAITVSEGLSIEYKKNFGVEMGVIMNASSYQELEASPVEEKRIRLVHQGHAFRRRKLEEMIDMMGMLDARFTLDLILRVSDDRYLRELKERAGNDPRIIFREALRADEIVAAINEYDIGIYIMPPSNFNMENALPNKLFQFIQARLGVAIGPTPEMAKLVKDYRCGVVARDFSAKSLAKELNSLGAEDVRRFKKQASIAAGELNYERESERLRAVFDSMVLKERD